MGDKLLTTLETEAQKRDNLEKSIYDLAHEQSTQEDEKDTTESNEEKDKNRVDYLSPFLAQYGKQALNKRQALQAKDECLATLKERLLERANIIQKHLDTENQKLQQRKQLFKRTQNGAGAGEADEEFTNFYEESVFRIDILKARLQSHEELALKKYVKMNERLEMDPRLSALNPE